MAYTDNGKLRVVYGDYVLGVHGKGFDYTFSYAQGGLESIVKNGYEWLYRCPKPTFWRALTDNDRGSKFHIKSGSWMAADTFIDCQNVEVIMDGEMQKQYAPDNNIYGGDVSANEIIVKFTYKTISNPSATVLVSYTVTGNGKIRVDVEYHGVKGLPELPVFGMRFIMPTLADSYMYEGLSGETYPDRQTGSLIAFEAGESITYGLFNAQERGTLFIGPGVKVYSGMVIGQSPKAEDVEINVCKTKKLTNTRSSSADEALKLTPPKIMSLEQCLDFIDTDELLEVTPESLRIRKKILDPTLRKRASFKNK